MRCAMRGKSLVLTALVSLLLFGMILSAHAKFPERPVTIVVPFGVGGGADTFARAIQGPLSRALGVPVVIVNVEGGGGLKGMIYAAQQPADGYTLFLFTTSHLIASILKRADVDLFKDFEILARLQHDVSVLWVSSKSKFKTFNELLEWAKKNPYALTIAGTSPLGFDEFRDRYFAKQFGLKITFVPFESSSQAQAATLGGFVISHMEEPLAIKGLIDSGEGRVLVVMWKERLPLWPDVPCVKEFGVEDYIGVFRAFAVKKGTPPEAIEVLSKAIEKAVQDPEYLDFLKKTMGDLRPGYLPGAQFLEELKKEKIAYEEIAKELGYIK